MTTKYSPLKKAPFELKGMKQVRPCEYIWELDEGNFKQFEVYCAETDETYYFQEDKE